jgi:hypothetical protein
MFFAGEDDERRRKEFGFCHEATAFSAENSIFLTTAIVPATAAISSFRTRISTLTKCSNGKRWPGWLDRTRVDRVSSPIHRQCASVRNLIRQAAVAARSPVLFSVRPERARTWWRRRSNSEGVGGRMLR